MSPLNCHYKPGGAGKVLRRNGKAGCRGEGKSGSDGRIGVDGNGPRSNATRTLTEPLSYQEARLS